MSDESVAVMNYAIEHQGHLHTDEPSSGTGGHSAFSVNRKESWDEYWLFGVNKGQPFSLS